MFQTSFPHTATLQQITETFVWTCLNQQLELEFAVVSKEVYFQIFQTKVHRAVWQNYKVFHYHISNAPNEERSDSIGSVKCKALVSISFFCIYFILLVVFLLVFFCLAFDVLLCYCIFASYLHFVQLSLI